MGGFPGFKSAATEELPDATAVMDPFHVVHLAGNALDECPSMRLRHVSGWEASQVLKTCLERPGTMSKSRQGPLLGADGPGGPPSDGGAYRPGPGCVLEEPPTPLS